MSYCIRVEAEAGETLRTLRGYVVQRLGSLLAEIASELTAHPQPAAVLLARSGGATVSALKVDDCVLFYQVDIAQRAINVLSVKTGESPEPAGASTPA